MDHFDSQPLVSLDTSELLGFEQSRAVTSEDATTLTDLCRLLSKRGGEVPPAPVE